MENFDTLLKLCAASCNLYVNNHKDYYETVEQNLKEHKLDICESIYNKMVETNTIVELHFYPDTPVGFYRVFHYDIGEAIKIAINIIKKQR